MSPSDARLLDLEKGGHRVQRIPANDKRGRVHTSTVTVAVLADVPTCEASRLGPEPAFPARDLKVEWFHGTVGAGGQHHQKHACCVRLRHLPSGLVETRQGRSRDANLREAKAAMRTRVAAAEANDLHDRVARNRRDQVGTGMRGDKTVTIRCQDDRVTHHVTGKAMSAKRYLAGHMDDLWA